MPLIWALATSSERHPKSCMECCTILASYSAMFIRNLILLALLAAAQPSAAESYQSPDEFLQEVFATTSPSPQVLWLKGEIKETAAAILGHPYPALRIRYWTSAGRTAWILEEIGKEKPITVGMVIGADGMEMLRVLEFRESRGWEVRYPFFTDQFAGIGIYPRPATGPAHRRHFRCHAVGTRTEETGTPRPVLASTNASG